MEKPVEAPSPKENLESAKRNAEFALRQYTLNSVGEQVSPARALKVNEETVSDVFTRKFVLEQKLLNGRYTANELKALTEGLEESMKDFQKAIGEKEDADPKSKENLKTATSDAEFVLREYDLNSIGDQIGGARKLKVNETVVDDVITRKFLLEQKLLRGNATATSLKAMTQGLRDSIKSFQAAVSAKEAADPKAEENAKTANDAAEFALKQYKLNNVGGQITGARKLKVSERLIDDVITRKFVLEQKTIGGRSSATELKAMTQALEKSIKDFQKAVEKAESDKNDQSSLQKIEKSFG